MSYDIRYIKKESKDKPYGEKQLIKVAPYISEGGTHRAELVGDTLVATAVTECELNITYNYSPFYYEHIDSKLGIRWLYGKTGAEVKERLEKAIQILGIEKNNKPFLQITTIYTIGQIFKKKPLPSFVTEEKYKDYLTVEDWDNHPEKDKLLEIGFLQDGGAYWKATPGNAGNALMRILILVIQNPDGIFEVD